MRPAIIFDDASGNPGPLTSLRASFEVRTGARTTLRRHAELLPALASAEVRGVYVGSDLVPLVASRCTLPVNDPGSLGSEDVILVNGRCVIPPEEIGSLGTGEAIEDEHASIVAACLGAESARIFLESGEIPDSVKRQATPAPVMLDRPWDVVRHRDLALESDLERALHHASEPAPEHVQVINPQSVRIAPGAGVQPGVILDAERGPVVVGENATVRPGAVLVGPCFIGPGSTVLERALIKSGTAVGPVCKVAGEIGGTIFQGYSNKAHDGHLGDAFVGEWVNLGAGTTNSNLLNTYANVKASASPDAPREDTGMTFFGCVLGDHCKLAICTRIMTGSVFGTGCMVSCSGLPPTSLAPFTWLTDRGAEEYRLDRFLDVMHASMARRSVEPDEHYIARLRHVHAGACGQRT